MQDGQKKFIETETAAQMLGVVLPDGPLTARFQAFLGEQTEYKVVSADQWLGIYRFSQEARRGPLTLTLSQTLFCRLGRSPDDPVDQHAKPKRSCLSCLTSTMHCDVSY